MIKKYLGVPFKDGGRDLDGLDCWGLFMLVMREFGHEVPDYKVSCFDTPGIGAAFRESIGQWYLAEGPSPGVAVAMAIHEKAPDMIQHFGVALNKHRFIHTLEKTGVIITRLDDPFFKAKIKGLYEWRSKSR